MTVSCPGPDSLAPRVVTAVTAGGLADGASLEAMASMMIRPDRAILKRQEEDVGRGLGRALGVWRGCQSVEFYW